MKNNSDNPNSNIILNLQKENMQLKEQLKEFQEHIRAINLALEKTKEKSYIEGYKQASKDNAVNIKLSPNLGAASGDFTLSSAQPNANGDVFPKHLPISSFASEFRELIAQEYSKMKDYK